MKVFQVGFGKCGTSSLHQFFLNSGYRSIHWGGGELAKSISRNVNNRNYILDGLDDYDFYTDMQNVTWESIIHAYIYYEYFYYQVEKSKFIFNTRPVERWIISIINHTHMFERYASCLNKTDFMGVLKELSNHYYNHSRMIMDFFKDKKDRFIVFDISKDHIKKVIDFLPEFDLNCKYWEFHNVTDNRNRGFLERFHELTKTASGS